MAEARAASGRFLNYGKQHKKIRVCKTLGLADFGGSAGGLRPLFEYGKQHKKIRVRKTLGLADFGGSAGGLRPLWIRMGLLHMNSPIDTRITAN